MILLTRAQLRCIADHAEQAYPEECCGLLVGHATGAARWVVHEVHPSPNLAPRGRDRFEVDPQLRLDLQRRSRAGPERVIGVYHSHPDHAAQPSATDLAMAWEPELLWLIAAVEKGQAIQITAHRLVAGGARFREIALRTSDRREAPESAPATATGGR